MKQINKNLKQKCGVYIITNLVNSKKYIGSSIPIKINEAVLVEESLG